MLPAYWKPARCQDLVRVGPRGDGGYVVPESVLHNSHLLFGLGIGDDCRFEKEFNRKAGCPVICFDHTVADFYWRHKFELDFIAFVGARRQGYARLKDMLTRYVGYKRFFDGKSAIHYKTMIGFSSDRAKDIHQLMAMSSHKNVFFKIDIEGWEYRIFDQLLEHSSRIIGFVIEFHDVDLHRERISKLIEASKKDFELVHLHANNNALTDPIGDPLVAEFTWVRRDLFVPSVDPVERSYPVSRLDYPNDPKVDDIPLRFEVGVQAESAGSGLVRAS